MYVIKRTNESSRLHHFGPQTNCRDKIASLEIVSCQIEIVYRHTARSPRVYLVHRIINPSGPWTGLFSFNFPISFNSNPSILWHPACPNLTYHCARFTDQDGMGTASGTAFGRAEIERSDYFSSRFEWMGAAIFTATRW